MSSLPVSTCCITRVLTINSIAFYHPRCHLQQVVLPSLSFLLLLARMVFRWILWNSQLVAVPCCLYKWRLLSSMVAPALADSTDALCKRVYTGVMFCRGLTLDVGQVLSPRVLSCRTVMMVEQVDQRFSGRPDGSFQFDDFGHSATWFIMSKVYRAHHMRTNLGASRRVIHPFQCFAARWEASNSVPQATLEVTIILLNE